MLKSRFDNGSGFFYIHPDHGKHTMCGYFPARQ